MAGEVISHILGRHLLLQPSQGYHFSIDSVLLADFAPLVKGPVADLGAGSGILCVLLAAKGVEGPYTALELDSVAAYCCRENLARTGAEARVFQQDLTQKNPEVPGNSYSLVISNPPFTPKGAGRVPPDPARARARHELNLEPKDLWRAAARLLKPKGRFVFCWPAARLVQAFGDLPRAGLMPKRLRLSHGREGKPASLAMVEAVKGGKEELTVEPPLIVYAEGQEQSKEVQAIYRRLS